MATIAATDMIANSEVAVTETTLDGSSDTFTYNAGKNPVLVFRNDSGGALTPVIDGDGGTTRSVAGLGSVDVSGGFTFGEIADGDTVAIRLNTISSYLQGTITITSGTGLVASLLEF